VGAELTSKWYVLRSKPHKERILWRQLRDQGFEVFYPHILLHTVKPGVIKNKPLFPGYLFVNVNLDLVGKSTFNWMPLSNGLVSIDGKPALVPEALINAIRRHLDSINTVSTRLFKLREKHGEIREQSEINQGHEEFLDVTLPDADRVKALFRMLQGVHEPSELDIPDLTNRT
jgi:transcription antitermination factor NusG